MHEELKTNLKTAIAAQNMTVTELAKRADLKPSFIYDILNGKSRNPGTNRLAQIANVLGIKLTELLGIEDKPVQPLLHGEGYVLVSSALAVQVNGQGENNLTEVQADPYYFRRSWLRNRLGAEAENLRIVRVEGDGMEPTLCQGDVVLVDVSRTNPSPPGVFVIFDGMGLLVKRIEFIPHSVPPTMRVLSDNPQYHPFECEMKDAYIIGRVVWFAREI